MIILTEKQIGLLCALYDETVGDLSDFMDVTDLSFKRIGDTFFIASCSSSS